MEVIPSNEGQGDISAGSASKDQQEEAFQTAYEEEGGNSQVSEMLAKKLQFEYKVLHLASVAYSLAILAYILTILHGFFTP